MHGALFGFVWGLILVAFYLLKYVKNSYVGMTLCVCLVVAAFKLHSHCPAIDDNITLPPPTPAKKNQ